ncbi:MAG: ABC transporter ATP-binding protein [Alphaproteobacteria bacterium]|nr:ABC transporter ATP-binding protein [Alphaproteobacteria bacterium]
MTDFTTPAHDVDYAIRLDRLDKIYRGKDGKPGKHALKSLTLDVPRGCIFGLLGPNGAGKSTMINILAGTVVKTSGAASVWGVDIDDNPRQARANIGIVPQELNIDAYFTPRETLDMISGMFGVPKAERRVDEILEEIGLTDQAHSYARTLSGGMRRRLLVGKAMVHQPPILILDEPTAGVDVALRQKLWDMIRELNRNGVTIVLTTHYLEEAEALCDRIAIINHGTLITEASTEDLLKGAGSKTLVLTLEHPPQTMPKALDAFATSLDGNQLKITYAPDKMAAGELLSRADAMGLKVVDVRTEEPNLEDVFLTLVHQDEA